MGTRFLLINQYLLEKCNVMNLLNEEKIYNIIVEELTKSEVNSMISSKIDSAISSRELKKKIKEISADVINEFFKVMWQRNSMWKSNVTKA